MHITNLGKDQNSKWIEDLDVRLETLNLLEENIMETLQGISIGNGFLDRIQNTGNKTKN